MASDFNSIQQTSLGVHETIIFYSFYDNSRKKMLGNKIDVYLQPLVKEMNELWAEGVET